MRAKVWDSLVSSVSINIDSTPSKSLNYVHILARYLHDMTLRSVISLSATQSRELD